MQFYFLRDPKAEFGLDCLKIAAGSGHATASYILGMNLICNGDGERERQEGAKLLGANIMTSLVMRQCRNDLKYRVWALGGSSGCKWSIEPKLFPCPAVDPQHKAPSTWIPSDEEEDRICCQNCRWNLEIHYVDCLLRDRSFSDCPDCCEKI